MSRPSDGHLTKGHRFQLKTATLGIMFLDGRRVAATVPASAIIEIRSNADSDRLIEVLWEDKELLMFVVDILERGINVAK